MKITFSKNAWEDYISWQKEDKRMLCRINELIKDIQRTPFEGIEKPEPLKSEQLTSTDFKMIPFCSKLQ